MGCPTPKCLGLRRQWPKQKVGCGWSGSGSVGLSRVAWSKDDSQATCQTWVIAMAKQWLMQTQLSLAEVCAIGLPGRVGGQTGGAGDEGFGGRGRGEGWGLETSLVRPKWKMKILQFVVLRLLSVCLAAWHWTSEDKRTQQLGLLESLVLCSYLTR